VAGYKTFLLVKQAWLKDVLGGLYPHKLLNPKWLNMFVPLNSRQSKINNV
jgi:hypothetical protein